MLEEGRQSQDALVEQFREKSQRELQHVQETCEAKVRDLESVVKVCLLSLAFDCRREAAQERPHWSQWLLHSGVNE